MPSLEASSANRTRYYAESTNAHPWPVVKLGQFTADIYLHLSERDLYATASPLDSLKLKDEQHRNE